jgi:hypothetical protein
VVKRRVVAVWLHEEAARTIVGASHREGKPPSRWVIQGTIVEEVGFGVWLEADTIEELRRGEMADRIEWMFKFQPSPDSLGRDPHHSSL